MQDKFKPPKRFENLANFLFNVPKLHIESHINDNQNVITKDQSEIRIIWLITILAICLSIGVTFNVCLLFELTKHDQVASFYHQNETYPLFQQLQGSQNFMPKYCIVTK